MALCGYCNKSVDGNQFSIGRAVFCNEEHKQGYAKLRYNPDKKHFCAYCKAFLEDGTGIKDDLRQWYCNEDHKEKQRKAILAERRRTHHKKSTVIVEEQHNRFIPVASPNPSVVIPPQREERPRTYREMLNQHPGVPSFTEIQEQRRQQRQSVLKRCEVVFKGQAGKYTIGEDGRLSIETVADASVETVGQIDAIILELEELRKCI